MNEKTEQEILKDIMSGKYRDFYLIYNRKSTDEKENQKNSIKVQKGANTQCAFDKKLKIAQVTLTGFCADGIISEKHSGFKENNDLNFSGNGMVQYQINRPKFLKLVEFLSRGLFKGVICLCWDRISRNRGDDTVVRKLMKKGVDFHFKYADYDKSSAGALHMDVDGMFAEHHSRVTSEKVTLTTRILRDEGVCTYKAPVGYLNQGSMDNKPIDPIRGPIIKKMFELYARGDKSVADLARWANDQGFTTAPMRVRRTPEEMLAEDNEDDDEDEELKSPKVSRAITANNVQKILKNRFYTGVIRGNDNKYVKSVSHKALITEETFDKVQLILKKKKVSSYYPNRVESLFRGSVRCEECGRVYTPYKQKGIQYYGARCQDNCSNPKKSFNILFLGKGIDDIVMNLSFSDEEIGKLDVQAKTDLATLEEKRNSEIESTQRRKKKLKEDLGYLKENKISLLKSGVYSPEDYVEEENKLNESLRAMEAFEGASSTEIGRAIKDVVKLSELVKYGYEYMQFANSEEKEKISKIVFSELLLSEDTFNYKARNGIRVLQNRKNAICDPTGSRTRL